MTSRDETASRFLNVDLDVLSDECLDSLLAALQPHVDDLHNERTEDGYLLVLELSGITANADSTIAALVDHIQRLPPSARAMWDRAKLRTFDIGIQAGMHPHQIREVLQPSTVQAVASVGAGISFTLYAPIVQTRE